MAVVPSTSGPRQPFAALAGRQHGLISVTQLSDLGWSRSARSNLVAQGGLVSVRRSVVQVAGAAWTWEADLLAAVLAGGPDVVASHLSALRLWRLVEAGSPSWTSRLHVTSDRHLRISGVVVHHRRVDRRDRAVRFGVPVTSAARTVVDAAEVLDAPGVGRALDEGLRRRILTLPDVRSVVAGADAAGRRRGMAAIRDVLADRASGYQPGASDWEREMDACWDRWGLPASVRQHTIRTAHGTYRTDRAIIDLRIAIDWNGYEYHGSRSRFDRDSDRRAHLVSAGWLPLDFTAHSAPDLICDTVRSACAQRTIELR